MSEPTITIFDLDFPVGSRNKTATLITGEREAVLVDAGFTRMAALSPSLVVPGHRLPGASADASAIAATREYLLSFEKELASAADSEGLISAMIARYPNYGLAVSIEIGAKVALGEMEWG